MLEKKTHPRTNVRNSTLAALAFATLSVGCRHIETIPDPTVPHQVARESVVEVWCVLKDGKRAPCKVRLLPGWWIAGPPVVEAAPP